MEPITLGLIFTVVWQDLLESKATEVFDYASLRRIRALTQGDKIVSHDLEKELEHSFLEAQQIIAEECKRKLNDRSITGFRERIGYSEQDRKHDIRWLDDKIQQLRWELEQIIEDD